MPRGSRYRSFASLGCVGVCTTPHPKIYIFGLPARASSARVEKRVQKE